MLEATDDATENTEFPIENQAVEIENPEEVALSDQEDLEENKDEVPDDVISYTPSMTPTMRSANNRLTISKLEQQLESERKARQQLEK